MSKKYRKKPVEIEAIQYTQYTVGSVKKFVDEEYWGGVKTGMIPQQVIIETDEGEMRATEGDFIIKGINGEFYPCKPDVFSETYELVEDKPKWEKCEECDSEKFTK